MIHRIRVIFGDTDQMGVVYHGNYLRFFEASRAALLRGVGHSQKTLDDWGIALPVVEAHCRYRLPAWWRRPPPRAGHASRAGRGGAPRR